MITQYITQPGLPTKWNEIITVVSGLFVCVLAYRLKPEMIKTDENNIRTAHVEYKSESAPVQDIGIEKVITNQNSQQH